MISVREREGGEGEKQTIKRLKHYCFHVTTPILYSTWETNKQVQQVSPLSNFLFFHVFFLFHDINGHHKGCWPQNSHSLYIHECEIQKRGGISKTKTFSHFSINKTKFRRKKKKVTKPTKRCILSSNWKNIKIQSTKQGKHVMH